MGNRSFLYIGTADAIASGDGRPFADANNNFPTLWQLLLAGGVPATANDSQRVFGDAGTPNLSSPVDEGIARIRRLADGIVRHPSYPTVPNLSLQFDAFFQYVAQHADACRADAPDAPLYFSANLDELSWLDDDSPQQFITTIRHQCDTRAATLDATLALQSWAEVDGALALDEYGASFSDWSSWAWSFGFGGLDHPYFAQREAFRDIPFAAYTPEPSWDDGDDEADPALADGEAWLSDRFITFTDGDAVGVRTHDTREVVIPAAWESVALSGHPDASLFWVRRDGKFGLLRAGASGVTVLHPCELDDTWNFEQTRHGWLAIVQRGDVCGVLTPDGTWHAAPEAFTPPLSELWAFDGDLAVARAGDRFGVVHVDGKWCVAPQWDDVTTLDAARGRLLVQRDGRAGVCDAHDRVLMPAEYMDIGALPDVGQRQGSGRPDGECMLVWRETDEGRRCGVYDIAMQRERLACEYDHLFAMPLWRHAGVLTLGYLAVRYAPDHTDETPQPLRVGILHADGSVLCPLVHAWIGERYTATSYVDAAFVAKAIFDAWSDDQPVQAALSDEDRYVWLTRDGAVLDDVSVREAQFASGDFAAAHALGVQYRDGVGVPRDLARAERWLLLAAGQPPTVVDAPPAPLLRRLFGAAPRSPLLPANPDPHGSVQAICDLCHILVESRTDMTRLMAAREWLELVNADAARVSAEAQMLLGYVLMDGLGGPPDEARAFTLAQRAATRGNTVADFNLGVMYEHGRGTAVDLSRARLHYSKAARAGDAAAREALARLLG